MVMYPPGSKMFAAPDSNSLNAVNDSTEETTRYQRHLERYRNRLSRLIPTHTRLQFYGDMGIASVGFGWDYGKKAKWETDVLFGLVPKYNATHAHLTFTIKQGFMPWTVDLGESFQANPLTCGMYLNAILGNEFWLSQPNRYPKGYYWFSTRLQAYIYAGQSLTYIIPEANRKRIKAISAFYEIGTNDSYILSKIPNNELRLRDILKLSFGLKFNIF